MSIISQIDHINTLYCNTAALNMLNHYAKVGTEFNFPTFSLVT